MYEAELAALPSTVMVASLPKGGEKSERGQQAGVVLAMCFLQAPALI